VTGRAEAAPAGPAALATAGIAAAVTAAAPMTSRGHRRARNPALGEKDDLRVFS
jgi:hypothetical protein